MNEGNEEAGPELDLDVLLTRAEAEVGESAEIEADDDGPGDESGELSADDAPLAADEESDDDGDYPDDDADDLADEDQDDALEIEDGDSDDDEADDEADQDDPEEDPRILELERKFEQSLLRTAELERQNQQLMELARAGAVPSNQPQEQRDPEFEAAWLAANVGGDEALRDYSPAVKKKVLKTAQQLAEARAHWALNPEAEYQTRFEPLVQRAIQQAIQPFMEARERQTIESVLAPHQEFLEQHRELVQQHLPPTYGAQNPNDPRVMQQRLETAVALAKAKLAEGSVRKRESKVKTKERQAEAKRRSRKRGSRKPRKAQVKAPKLGGVDGDDLSAFAAKLAADPALLEQAERDLRR